MEYWISQKGKKSGPLKEWDIRALIDEGNLTEEDLVWHSDLPKWVKVADYSAFQSYFQKEPEPTPEMDELEAAKRELKQKIEEATGQKVPEGAIIRIEKIQNHYWVRRGFAKVLDLLLYFTLFYIVANYFGFRFGLDPELSWVSLVYLVPFCVLEGLMIYHWGTTLGKRILGLQVQTIPGLPDLDFNRAFIRSISSWFLGMAMGFFPWFIIAMALTFFSTKRRGITTWDAFAKTRVVSQRPVKAMSIITFILVFVSVNLSIELFTKYHKPTRIDATVFREQQIKNFPPEVQDSLREFLIPKPPPEK